VLVVLLWEELLAGRVRVNILLLLLLCGNCRSSHLGQ